MQGASPQLSSAGQCFFPRSTLHGHNQYPFAAHAVADAAFIVTVVLLETMLKIRRLTDIKTALVAEQEVRPEHGFTIPLGKLPKVLRAQTGAQSPLRFRALLILKSASVSYAPH